MTPGEVRAYLARIGLNEAPRATLEGLTRLQRTHMLSVPFENLDIILGRGIDLGSGHLFAKIVGARRGGYCYELNGLYGLLLDALGFERRPVSARVWYRDPPDTPGLTHTLKVVTLPEGEFLSDVGFGGLTARVPVPLGDDVCLSDSDGEIALTRDPAFGYRLRRETPDGWIEQFTTDAVRAYPSDMALGSHFMSTHPSSHFRAAPLAGLFTPEGRDGIVGRTLSVRRGWQTETTEITDLDAYEATLRDRFGLDVGEDAALLFGGASPAA